MAILAKFDYKYYIIWPHSNVTFMCRWTASAYCYRAGVSNTRPARGFNAARQHQEKFRFLKKYTTIWPICSIWPQNSKNIFLNFFQCGPRVTLSWDPCYRVYTPCYALRNFCIAHHSFEIFQLQPALRTCSPIFVSWIATYYYYNRKTKQNKFF